jgi:dinuclear metal center YbgI/SA1388 family protein
MLKIKDIVSFLEKIAPPQYQATYDNAGLLVGDPEAAVTGILTCLDSTEAIVAEAQARGCNLIVAHHPIVFSGLKRFTGRNYVEKTVMAAIKNDVAIYAIHTNLDSVLSGGVNAKFAEKIGLKNCKILAPVRQNLMKLSVFTPKSHTQIVLNALYEAGAGQIGDYKNCSFRTEGIGTFESFGNAKPFIGEIGIPEEIAENKIEIIFESHLKNKIFSSLRKTHPYETIAYYLHTLENENQTVGAGMIGELETPMPELDFLRHVKKNMQASCVKHTDLRGQAVRRVAICGGAGGFLLPQAIAAGADVFVTSDYKYHEFFDAEGKIVIADIGHYESEQFTTELLQTQLTNWLIEKKLGNFEVFSTNISTNPVNYL